MLPKSILYHGTQELPPNPLKLRAGPLSMIFEPATGFLRRIRLGDLEVIRAIYGAVRDHHWETILPSLTGLETEIQDESFRLRFEVLCRTELIHFWWRGVVTGEASGRISYAFHGEARSDFLRNRIGLCVLHPITECAGRECVVQHTDGRKESGTFPKLVSPHQPFLDIQGCSWEIPEPGVRAELAFEGEVFETEDQRNWTDASYKTYSTPLSLPMPVLVAQGTKIEQTVALSLTGLTTRTVLEAPAGPPELTIATSPALLWPPLGHCVASHGQPLSPREVERLKRVRAAHLRVDLELSNPGYVDALERASREARQLDTRLHVALIVGKQPERELIGFAAESRRVRSQVAAWLIFHREEVASSEKWVCLAKSILLDPAADVAWATGTRQNFAELNRAWPHGGFAVFPCFSANPQAHMFDYLTMVENVAAQADAVETARRRAGQPVIVSPITLRPSAKFVPREDGVLGKTALPSDVDPRQMALFGAAWTLGSISRLAATGKVHSLTYFETTGWRGLMETEGGSHDPDRFFSRPGWVFPVYHLFADLGEFSARQTHPTCSSHPLALEGLALSDGQGRLRFLVANLTSEVQEAGVRVEASHARVRYLDESNAEEAMSDPETFRARPGTVVAAAGQRINLRLLPFGLARIDVGE